MKSSRMRISGCFFCTLAGIGFKQQLFLTKDEKHMDDGNDSIFGETGSSVLYHKTHSGMKSNFYHTVLREFIPLGLLAAKTINQSLTFQIQNVETV